MAVQLANPCRTEVIMKRAGQCLLLFGVLTFASSQRVANPVLLLAAPQSSAAHPPDAPPAGQPMPGQPVEYHPKPPHPPEDFQQGPDGAQARRRKVDAAQAQKDAQELTELARTSKEKSANFRKLSSRKISIGS